MKSANAVPMGPMSKNTPFSLGDHFTAFIEAQIAQGRYGSASDVTRAGLRLLEAGGSQAGRAARRARRRREERHVRAVRLRRLHRTQAGAPTASR
jgi:antitoxin ParD1/3/4